MTDSLKLAEMQRTSIEFERQRHLANWFIKSSPHMATPATAAALNGSNAGNNGSAPTASNAVASSNTTTPTATVSTAQQGSGAKHSGNSNSNSNTGNGNPVFYLMSSNGNTGAPPTTGKHSVAACALAGPPTSAAAAAMSAGNGAVTHLHIEGRKPKLRRFNSHDTSSNMFSVADFEYARLTRRNEIEMKQRLQRRMRILANIGYGDRALNPGGANGSVRAGCLPGDSKLTRYTNDAHQEPLPADVFLERYSLPRVVRLSYSPIFSDETLQSSSSNGSSTVTSHSSASGGTGTGTGTSGLNGTNNSTGTGTTTGTGTGTGTSSSTASSSVNITSGINHNNNNTTGSNGSSTKQGNARTVNGIEHLQQDSGELFLLYRLIRGRNIYHGHNAKTALASLKKGVLIPQEFPGFFSYISDKGAPTATVYTSLMQLVRERVYKFISVDSMAAFTESQNNANNSPTEGCLPIYSSPPAANRPQYLKITARGGQVFRLIAVFEDGKQDHNAMHASASATAKSNTSHGREKEKGRYAQLISDSRQMMYVPLSTKGKFYEIEPGIPQILQKHSDPNRQVKPDCVYRITSLITPNKKLPVTLRYITGTSCCINPIPENVCITKITTENVMIACPIEDVEVQSPLRLRKLQLTKEMNLLKSTLGFESEQRMLANPNVQNMLKYCQFNCDQFLKMVDMSVIHRPERSGSKSRVEALRILRPLYLPRLLRREKTTISAHEKEDSIIFLSKNDLANLEAKEARLQSVGGNRITEKMKVFQSTKKKWFRKQDKHAVTSLTSLDLDVQAKRMSMERYSDMSKLLQERFGDKPNTISQEHESTSEPSATSEIGCSDTETTTLATIEEKFKKFVPIKSTETVLQKSMSLQDIESIGRKATRKPDLLSSHGTAADTISEAGTDLEDLENFAPMPQSFITEKLYNEFHVKTRQYSKSSSSLHQLLNFSLPQKLQLHDAKRSLAQIKHNSAGKTMDKRLDFNIGEPVMGRRAGGGFSLLAVGSSGNSANSQNTSLISPLTPTSLIEDDLPYSSVRDSLVLSSDESASEFPRGHICQALNLIDYTKENIYAEICHDANAMGGIPNSHTRDTFSGDTHSTQVSDDYGDYASLTYPSLTQHYNGITTAEVTAGNAISRVQINCSSSPVSYHTVYLGDEPLGEQYAERRRGLRLSRDSRNSHDSRDSQHSARDRAHITTVELEGTTHGASSESETVDNIYNTLK